MYEPRSFSAFMKDAIRASRELEAATDGINTDVLAGLQIVDALAVVKGCVSDVLAKALGLGLLVVNVSDQTIASALRLMLHRVYPAEHEVIILRVAGTAGERVARVKLSRLHEFNLFDHGTSLYVPPLTYGGPERTRVDSEGRGFEEVVAIVRALRSKSGCPWDREQTRESLRPYVVEEAYEVLEAIESNEVNKLIEELGDLLLQVVLQSIIGEQRGEFTVTQVLDSLADKLLRRHPHVFGPAAAFSPDEAIKSWETIKENEGKNSTRDLLDGVPKQLPALLAAFKVQQRAGVAGFDWPDAEGVFEKIDEELKEVCAAWEGGERNEIEAEVGDLLFSVVNLARKLGVNPEMALRGAISRFVSRFEALKQVTYSHGKKLEDMSLDEMDELWRQLKERGN